MYKVDEPPKPKELNPASPLNPQFKSPLNLGVERKTIHHYQQQEQQ
jgi:hypothetical protein